MTRLWRGAVNLLAERIGRLTPVDGKARQRHTDPRPPT